MNQPPVNFIQRNGHQIIIPPVYSHPIAQNPQGINIPQQVFQVPQPDPPIIENVHTEVHLDSESANQIPVNTGSDRQIIISGSQQRVEVVPHSAGQKEPVCSDDTRCICNWICEIAWFIFKCFLRK